MTSLPPPPPDDDDITQVTRIYTEAEQKLARTTEAGEKVVDAALALERAVVEPSPAVVSKVKSVIPAGRFTRLCRACGLPEDEHDRMLGETPHLFLARNEDR